MTKQASSASSSAQNARSKKNAASDGRGKKGNASAYWQIEAAMLASGDARAARVAPSGTLFHVLNRGVGRMKLFSKEPNDVDCVLLIGPVFAYGSDAEEELIHGSPFLDMALVTEGRFRLLVESIFASDRRHIPKSVVEVIL